MRYGFCTWFATEIKDGIDYDLLSSIKRAGFDFAEFPLMLTACLPERDFTALAAYMKQIGLAADCTCNFFPASIKVTGKAVDVVQIDAYLDVAFERVQKLGTKTIIFGSSPSRDLDEETTEEQAYRQICQIIRERVLPRCEKFDVRLAMEAINTHEANFITQLSHSGKVTKMVGSERVNVMADLYHLLMNGEMPDELAKHLKVIDHIHISELQRALPVDTYSPRLKALLTEIKRDGYDKTISFETMPVQPNDMKRALQLLKKQFDTQRSLG